VSRRVLAAALLAGCGAATPAPETPKKCPAQSVTVSLLASRAINPTQEGAPRPVVVRLYQLKSDARLYNAPFEQVWHDDKTALGDDVVKVDTQELYPGMRVDVKFDRTEGVDHIAAVALFQQPRGRSWFSSFDLPPPPEAGKCDAQACAQDGDDVEDCATRAAGTGHYSFWLDGAKVDDGVEHLEQFPKVGPMVDKRGP
jgi:type VI secretion system protein VasD